MIDSAATEATVNWADQLTAFGTLAAVIISLAIAIYGAVVASIEKRARSRSRDEQVKLERSQAEKLHWWHELCSDHPLPYDDDALTPSERGLNLDNCWGEAIVIENLSDAPVHEVIIETPHFLLPEATVFAPGELGPTSRRYFHISGFGTSLIDRSFSGAGFVTFSDSQGRRWRRDRNGELAKSATTMAQDASSAEKSYWRLRRTLQQISEEQGWTNPAVEHIRQTVRWIATAPAPRTPAQSRLHWHQLRRADDDAFELLQSLKPPHYQRRNAEYWLRWRSGELTLDDLIREIR